MASLVRQIIDFLRDSIEGDPAAGDPPAPGKLGDIAAIKDKLTNIGLSTDHNGLTDWLAALDALQDVALRDTIIIRALHMRAPRLAETLTLAGLIRIEFRDTAPRAFAFRFAWDQLDSFLRSPGDGFVTLLLSRVQDLEDVKVVQVLTGLLLSAPRELLRLEYAQQGYAALPDPRPNEAIDLLALVNKLINSPLRLRLPFTPPLDRAAFEQAADPTIAPQPPASYLAVRGPDAPGPSPLDGFGVELKLADAHAFVAGALDLGGGLRLTAATPDSAEQTYRVVMKGGASDPDLASTGVFEAKIQYSPAGDVTTIGPANDTRLELGGACLSLRVQPKKDGKPLFGLQGTVERLTLVFSTKPLGLLSQVVTLPDEVRFQSDVSMGYMQGQGLQTAGHGAGLPPLATEFTAPLNLRVGGADAGLTIERVLVRLEVKLAGEGLQSKVSARFGANGAFGPVRIVADGMGAWFGNWDGGVGAVETPNALGVSLDAGPISGGGFLAKVGPDYAGGLELKVMGVGVGAFALFGQADGAPSFVGILGIRLPPPGVQIGFGFAISGVGGVIGVNRRTDTDVLREQIASGTSADILFCENPTRNAITVIGQLPRLFPGARGVFLIGPTFRITWLELLKLDAGLFIEMPGPRQIFIAGSARLVIGSEDLALVYLRLDFVGGVDITKSLIFFDAALVNSHVLQVFRITGGVALRIAYGDNGYFLFSVGGFHPSFNPGGLELPRLARAGAGASIAIAWFKFENYLALTSNTFQLGAAVEAGVKLGPISAHGWLRFDALIQFDPFYFVATIDAGFDVEVFGESLCGVRLQGKLSGPGPLVIEARASVKVLFVRVSESVTIRLGGDSARERAAVPDLLQALAPEFSNPANVRSEGEDRSVVLRPGAPTIINGAPVVGVIGAIIWEQKRAPFGLDLQRFEGVPLSPGRHHLVLSMPDATTEDELDWFGAGSFLTLSDSEALNNARFVQAKSGVRIPLDVQAVGDQVPCTAKLNLVKLPRRFLFPFPIAMSSYMRNALTIMQQERTGRAALKPGRPRITASQELWTAHGASGGAEQNISSTQAFLLARGGEAIAQPVTARTANLAGVF